MSHERPIDRVRDREDSGREPYEDARETYAEKDAQIKRDAPVDAPEHENEGDFKKRMEEKFKESGEKSEESP